ncbi:MAG TPA: PEGA domain-containing protein [Pseudothermotoga sp.]
MQKFIVLLLFASTCFAVNVVTNPPNVEIRYQQTVLAVTDRSGFASFDITLPATVVFSKPGYLPKQIFITDASTTYHVNLIPAASLMIDSQPKDAEVFINGNLCGRTPIEITLPPGEQNLILRKDGYCEIQDKINISPFERKQMNYQLTTIPTVLINSNPVSTVWIDGKEVGKTPIQIDLPSGDYSLTLKADDFFSLNKQIRVSNLQKQIFDFSLIPCATVKVHVVPDHAVVEFEDQKKLQPAVFPEIPLQEITMKISAQGYETKQITITPKQGMNELRVYLEPDIKILNIETNDDAMVYVDGKAISRGSSKIKVSGDLHWIEAKLGERSWAGLIDLTQTDSVKINFDYATLIMPKFKDVKYIVEGVTFYPLAITYLPAGFHTIEIQSDTATKRTIEFKAGSFNILKPDGGYGYLCVFSDAVTRCYINQEFIGLTPVLFYSVKPGTYLVQVGGKEFQVEVETGQIVYVH